MYAIIRTGGKQYTVQPGDTVRVEKLEKTLGEKFDITDVLFLGGEKTYVGAPTVQNAKVTVVVTQQAKAAKIVVFKKKRRQGYRRTQGHRQLFTELFVKSITSPEGKLTETDKKEHVIDPAVKAERLAAHAEKLKAEGKKKPAAKKVAKKAAGPKKKAAGRKRPAAKAGGAKKAAKKTTKKVAKSKE